MRQLDPDTDVTPTPTAPSTPHPGRPSEVSPGLYDAKHFQTCLGGPALLFLKFVHETAFGDTRWRSGAWIAKSELRGELGVSAWLVRVWVAALERDGYIRVGRSQKGYRITLSKRIWYRNGKPIVAHGVKA